MYGVEGSGLTWRFYGAKVVRLTGLITLLGGVLIVCQPPTYTTGLIWPTPLLCRVLGPAMRITKSMQVYVLLHEKSPLPSIVGVQYCSWQDGLLTF